MIWKVWDKKKNRYSRIVVSHYGVYRLSPFSFALDIMEQVSLDRSLFWIIIAWLLLDIAVIGRR